MEPGSVCMVTLLDTVNNQSLNWVTADAEYGNICHNMYTCDGTTKQRQICICCGFNVTRQNQNFLWWLTVLLVLHILQ